MGNENSTRWKGHTKRRTVDECRRINAREAQHVAGIATTTTPVATSAARRLWALCPACGAQVWYLYQMPSEAPDASTGAQWKCRQCHDLAYKSAQQRGTYAAFYEWLNQEKWREYADRHRSREWLYQRVGDCWKKLCLPYDLRNMSADDQLRLTLKMGGAEKVEIIFNHQRDKFMRILHRLESRAARWAMNDLKTEWKQRHRSNIRQKVKD
jgi:hypothetical protein